MAGARLCACLAITSSTVTKSISARMLQPERLLCFGRPDWHSRRFHRRSRRPASTKAQVVRRLRDSLQYSFGVTISAVTEGELRYGVAGRPDASRLQQLVNEFLIRVTVLPRDSAEAREYGKLRAALKQHGRPMGNLDLMIGSHTVTLSAVLVTHQTFRRIRKLKVEDWTRL